MLFFLNITLHGESVNTTPHRAHFTHANIFSRVAQGPERVQTRFGLCPLENNHSSFSCFMSYPQSSWLTSRLHPFCRTFSLHCIPRTVPNNHTIHGQKDSLVDWRHKVLLQGMSPTPLWRLAVQRSHWFSNHQGEQVSVQCIILVVTSQQRLYPRKSMKDKAWECWLHCCSRRTAKQVQPLQEIIAPLEKVLCQAHLTLEAQGDLSGYTHTNGHRAMTQETYRRHIPQEKGYGPRIKKLGITWNCEQINQPKENMQLCQDSLKRNIIRNYFLKSKGIRYCPKQDLTWIWQVLNSESADMLLRELNGQIRSHRMAPYQRNQEYEASRREQACSMQNYQTARQLNKMIVWELYKKWRNWKKFAVLKLREFKHHERMNFPETNWGEISPQ